MAGLTYREMWETHVEPNLAAQAEARHGGAAPAADPGPMTLDRKVAECQAAGFMFGADPLEVAKAARQSWPPKPADIQRIKDRLRAREAAKCSRLS